MKGSSVAVSNERNLSLVLETEHPDPRGKLGEHCHSYAHYHGDNETKAPGKIGQGLDLSIQSLGAQDGAK